MTEPNTFTLSDLHAAREIAKAQNNQAHWSAIERGEWDGWGVVQRASAEVIRQRTSEEQPDA